MEDINEIVRKNLEQRKNNILKGFVESENSIEKARHGVYDDTPENRSLNRVGQEYGEKKSEDSSKSKQKPEHNRKPIFELGNIVKFYDKGKGKNKIGIIKESELKNNKVIYNIKIKGTTDLVEGVSESDVTTKR